MTPHDRYATAQKALAARLVAEPHNLASVAAALSVSQLTADGHIARACLDLYAERRGYSYLSLSAKTGLTQEVLEEIADGFSDMTLEQAAAEFVKAYGQYIESLIAEQVPFWISKGYDSERIRTESETFRRTKGVGGSAVVEDGLSEFMRELEMSHAGIVPPGLLHAPIGALAKHVTLHEPDELIIIAGRPGMGKSRLALNYLLHNAKLGLPGTFFSLEMRAAKIYRYLWQMQTVVRFQRNMSHYPQGEKQFQVQQALGLKTLPIEAYSRDSRISFVAGMIRRGYYERGIKFAVVDYLQLLESEQEKGFSRNREQEIAKFTRTMKNLCNELQIPIIALSQLSRKVEDRGGMKRPQTADLRESGAIENDADFIALAWRPEYYLLTHDTADNGAEFQPGHAEISVVKGRNCGADTLTCRFNDIQGFYDAPGFSAHDSMFPIAPTAAWGKMPEMERSYEQEIPY